MFFGLLALTILSQGSVRSDRDRVVVVRNEVSPISRAVADDYARRRGELLCGLAVDRVGGYCARRPDMSAVP